MHFLGITKGLGSYPKPIYFLTCNFQQVINSEFQVSYLLIEDSGTCPI